jgi:S-formylglutathione hydrolase FrmB
VIYLPAAARRGPAAKLPVLLLLHGTSGGPSDWSRRGALVSTANAFAATHAGRAPIIVMPDINGAAHADSECVVTPGGGDVEQYLQVTVASWVIAHLPADPDRRHWAVAGLSEGGTCAAMLALTRPGNYVAFADFSGLAELTLGAGDSAALAREELFDGSQRAFDEHDPQWLLAHRTYRNLAAWLECGDAETHIRQEQARLAAATRHAGISTHVAIASGRHEWAVWSASLQQALPWLWQEMTA